MQRIIFFIRICKVMKNFSNFKGRKTQWSRKMLQEAINYTKLWHKPFLTYYGTEKGMSNETDIHQMPYGDEQVRKPMIWD